MNKKQKKMLVRIIISLIATILLLTIKTEGLLRLALYLAVYFYIGYDILSKAFKGIIKGQVFDENFLMALNHHELCVSDLTYILGLSQSAISHALGSLRAQKLVKTRREGKTIYYSLDDDHVTTILDMALTHIDER